MKDVQSIVELLDDAEEKQKGQNKQATNGHTTDTTTSQRGPRDRERNDDSTRYTPSGRNREVSRDRSNDNDKSDRGSANGSVRSRHRRHDGRSRSPHGRDTRDYRSRDGRSGNGGDFYRSAPADDDDRHYRPDNGDRNRRDNGDRSRRRDPAPRDQEPDDVRTGYDRREDRREDRSSRRDDRPREPRERRRSPVEPTDDERDRRTVFVQQLAARLRTRELKQFFGRAGPVVEAQIVKDRVSQRSKGVGYVEFEDEASVEKAIELTGQKLCGIPIIAQLTEAEKNRQAKNTEGVPTLSNGIPFHRLYVGNIHFSITEQDLSDVFEPFGKLEFCQLQREDQNRSKGYGFVQFADATNAKEALEALNGFELAGRPIRVGLGNDKFSSDSAQSMQQKFGPQGQGQNQSSAQGPSFSGMGGRGSHAGGTANFDRAGGRDVEKAGGSSALDDTDVAGVNFSNYSRDALMRKLARVDEPQTKTAPQAQQKNKKAPVDDAAPSRCVLLKNMYTEEDTVTPGWEHEFEDDVKTECNEKYGQVVHIGVAPGSTDGEIYVKFDRVLGGENAIKGLNGRFFAGQRITAQYLVEAVYNMNFPKASKV